MKLFYYNEVKFNFELYLNENLFNLMIFFFKLIIMVWFYLNNKKKLLLMKIKKKLKLIFNFFNMINITKNINIQNDSKKIETKIE